MTKHAASARRLDLYHKRTTNLFFGLFSMPLHAVRCHRESLKTLKAVKDNPATNQKVGSSTLSGRATPFYFFLCVLRNEISADATSVSRQIWAGARGIILPSCLA